MARCSSCGTELQGEFTFCPSCGVKLAGGESGSDSLLGRTLNSKYRLISEVGAGNMGTVYLAEHLGLKKRVAIKVLHPDLRVSSESLQRFQREGIAAGKFTHPNAIQIFDFDQGEDRLFYLAMEFIDGENLKSRVRSRGSLPVAEAIELMRQILGVLSAAHRQGIVHRDLKPDNIMVMANEEGEDVVKVLDFGLSKLVDIPLDSSLQTQPGRIMGTPLYMSPEQCAGGEIDHRTDLYAAGLILYEMIAGHPPFQGSSVTEILLKHAAEPAPSLIEARPDISIPSDLDAIIHRALEKKPDDRFQSAAEMLEALDEARLDRIARPGRRRASASRSRSRRPVRSRKPVVAISIIAILVIGALAAILLVPGQSASSKDAFSPPRVSMKDPADRTQSEKRYVELLDEARRHLRGRDLDSARLAIEDALQLPCHDSEANLIRGQILSMEGDYDTAKAELASALKLDDRYLEAIGALGWLELDHGDAKAADEQFSRALAIDADAPQALAGHGAVLYERKEYQTAAEALERAIRLDSRLARAHYYLGMSRLALGDPGKAIEALVQAKRYDARDWKTLVALGEAYGDQGDAQQCEQSFRSALALNPTAVDAAIDLSALLIDAGRYLEALPILERAKAGNARQGRLQLLAGVAEYESGDLRNAIPLLEEGISLSPDEPRMRTLLGLLYLADGRFEPARAQLQAARDAGSTDPRVDLGRGLALFQLGQYTNAKLTFEHALESDPDNVLVHYALGILFMEYLDSPSEARAHFERYRELGGDDPRVESWLGSSR